MGKEIQNVIEKDINNVRKKQIQKNKNKTKVFHLTPDQVAQKIKTLEQKVKSLQGSDNKKIRQKIFSELAKLNKAQASPESFLRDPLKDKEKQDLDLKRRIEKKLFKKSIADNEKQQQAEIQALNPESQQNAINKNNKKCLNCKSAKHMVSVCPLLLQSTLQDNSNNSSNKSKTMPNQQQCYLCGAADHCLKDCNKKQKGQKKYELKYAVCFVCKKQGHISKDCPSNEKGIFYKGGSCFICQSVKHIAKDCPQNIIKQTQLKRPLHKSNQNQSTNSKLADDKTEFKDSNLVDNIEQEEGY